MGLASEVGGAVLWGSDLTLWGLLLSPGRQGQGGVNLWDTQPVPQRTAWWGKHPDIRDLRVGSEVLCVSKGDRQEEGQADLFQDTVQRR